MDQPDAPRGHQVPIRTGGDWAVCIGILLGLLGTYVGFPRFRQLLDYRYTLYSHGEMLNVIGLIKQLAGILVGLAFVVGLGMQDNRRRRGRATPNCSPGSYASASRSTTACKSWDSAFPSLITRNFRSCSRRSLRSSG